MTLHLNRPDPGEGSSCAGCNGQSGCGTSIFSSLFGQRTSAWRLPLLAGCRKGTQLTLTMPSRSLLLLAFVAYVLPIICLLFFAVAMHYLVGNQPLWISLGGISGLVGGVIAYPLLSKLVFTHLDWTIEVPCNESGTDSGQAEFAVSPLIPHNQLSR